MKPVQTFVVNANLPEKIAKLKDIAYNYWWCWDSDTKDLFIRMDRKIWDEVNHNPVMLINRINQSRLIELSQQIEFTSYLDYVHKRFVSYMESKSWYESVGISKKGTIAYFSTEYGINESFPIYSGGLGILSGDHLKSASDLGLPLIGVGLLYQQGYFSQHLTQNGWQTEQYTYNDFLSMPLNLCKNKDNTPLLVDVDLLGERVYAKVWKLNVGKIQLYLLDTNISENPKQEHKEICYQLYGGTRETRIQQEIVLGIGGVKALTALGIEPEVFHINEGHAAFALLERSKNLMNKYNLNFWTAKQIVQASSIFTTHTPVPAGNESFKIDRIVAYLENYWNNLGLGKEEFLRLGQQEGYDESGDFSMTVLGLKLTSYHNGVSKLHGRVSREMWSKIWQNFPKEEVPIKSITNGVHTLTWVAREMAELFDRYLSPTWREETDNNDIWRNVDYIPNEEIWREKQRRRVRLIIFARNYLKKKQKGYLSPTQLTKIDEYLNTDTLTIGFARRFATYKRATLLFSDMERLKAILTNKDQPVQIIIAGKAHPHDTQGKEAIQTIINKVKSYGLEKYVVFLENYDMVIARKLVTGCDVWLNNPIRPLEASGTSGMKAGLNGTLNFSILDGWWDESYNGANGFSIGEGEEYEDTEQQAIIEAGQAYDKLENVIIKTYYDRDYNNIPNNWVQMMKESIKTIGPQFSTTRMIKDYSRMYYFNAMSRFFELTENNALPANELREWKNHINKTWDGIKIIEIKTNNTNEIKVGNKIEISTIIQLGELSQDDVKVQVMHGNINHVGEIVNNVYHTLKFISSEEGNYKYEGSYVCNETGNQGITVRVVPKHKFMVESQELYLCKWA